MNAGSNTTTAESLFKPLTLSNVRLRNRLIRAATYEGCADSAGTPGSELGEIYRHLAEGGVGAIITGFVYVSQSGRAMQPRQCGIDKDEKIDAWHKVIDQTKNDHPDLPLFMQLAHAGRQTRREITGMPVHGASDRKCGYFRQKVHSLDDGGIKAIIDQFAEASMRAKRAGFDGIQIHAAHGYLIHQFLSPWTNMRKDRWVDGPLLLEEIIRSVRAKNGSEFPILVKLSWGEDHNPGIDIENTLNTVKRLEALNIDAVEISYGSMEYALNIMRGGCPVDVFLNVNPLFRHIPRAMHGLWKKLFSGSYLGKFIPFEENYNFEAARRIRSNTALSVIPVGGIRNLAGINRCLENDLSAVSLCRPLICEPDLPIQIKSGRQSSSKCVNCNLCTAYCDSHKSLRCYRKKEIKREDSGRPGRDKGI
ncbi:MAG: NADH:flavin oxidoreductase [Verrucomicrobiota bacterium]